MKFHFLLQLSRAPSNGHFCPTSSDNFINRPYWPQKFQGPCPHPRSSQERIRTRTVLGRHVPSLGFSKETVHDVELTVSIDESGRSANLSRVKSTQIIYKNGHFDQNLIFFFRNRNDMRKLFLLKSNNVKILFTIFCQINSWPYFIGDGTMQNR